MHFLSILLLAFAPGAERVQVPTSTQVASNTVAPTTTVTWEEDVVTFVIIHDEGLRQIDWRALRVVDEGQDLTSWFRTSLRSEYTTVSINREMTELIVSSPWVPAGPAVGRDACRGGAPYRAVEMLLRNASGYPDPQWTAEQALLPTYPSRVFSSALISHAGGVGHLGLDVMGSQPLPADLSRVRSLTVPSEAARIPNIVLLFADDLGWTDVSSGRFNKGNGSSYYQTPRIDGLASEGMSFNAAYSQQNCSSARAAMLSGQYAPRTGHYGVGGLFRMNKSERNTTSIVPPSVESDMDPDAVTIAELLKQAGYTTAQFGKTPDWGGRELLATAHGFDVDMACDKRIKFEVDGRELSRNYFAAKVAGEWAFANASYKKYAHPYTEEYIQNNLTPVAHANDPMTLVGTPKHFTDAIGDAAIDFIQGHHLDDQPFFMNVCFHAVHEGIDPRPDLRRKYAGITSEDKRHREARYAALTEGLDQTVGRILMALEDPNGDGDTSDSLRDNTVVMFYSDNGGALGRTKNRPLRAGKGTFFEGGIRVPMTVRWPGVITPGTISDEPVHVVDLYPTFAEMARQELPDPQDHILDGESFVKILTGETVELDRKALFWHFPGYLDGRLRPITVINQRANGERYKLFYHYEDEQYQLYNLTNDIREKENLLVGDVSVGIAEIAIELSDAMGQWLLNVDAQLGAWRESGQPVETPDGF